MVNFREDIRVDEARGRLLSIWTMCEFDIKERVKEKVSHRIVHNMLSNPNYRKLDQILKVISTIESEILSVEGRIEHIKDQYYTEIDGLLSGMG